MSVDWIPDKPLPRAIPGPEMCTFVRNKGFTNPPGPEQGYCFNPSGYGGTIVDGDPTTLVQIGGAQNTIGNTAPPEYPVGEVITYFAFQPVILAVGSIPAPSVLGDYTIRLSAGFGNVLDAPPPTGPPFPVSATILSFSPGECQFTVDSDCNENNTPDSLDVASGDSADCNDNGVPDECEPVTMAMMEHCVDGPCDDPSCAQPASGDACCDAADQDHDGDVDLHDYAMMILSMP